MPSEEFDIIKSEFARLESRSLNYWNFSNKLFERLNRLEQVLKKLMNFLLEDYNDDVNLFWEEGRPVKILKEIKKQLSSGAKEDFIAFDCIKCHENVGNNHYYFIHMDCFKKEEPKQGYEYPDYCRKCGYEYEDELKKLKKEFVEDLNRIVLLTDIPDLIRKYSDIRREEEDDRTNNRT